ncbi:MAG: hypothetical protein WBC91_22690 [Phototrophicaceae bacterium]
MPIVSGKYEHRENGVPNGITETWEYLDENHLHILFASPDYQLDATIILDENKNVNRFAYHVDETLNGYYQVQGSQLRVKRQLPANTQLDDTLVWSNDALLDLPFLSCKGHTILHLNQKGLTSTFAPILRSGDRAGDMAKQSVQKLEQYSLNINDRVYQTTHYRYLRDYWLDKNGIVIRAESGTYEMILVEYTP